MTEPYIFAVLGFNPKKCGHCKDPKIRSNKEYIMRNVTQFKPRHCFLYSTIQITYCRYDTVISEDIQKKYDIY